MIAVRRELPAAKGLDKLIQLGPIFFAASLAAFGAEHLSGAQFVMQAVPAWMPARLAWTYFVGLALIAAAGSIIASRWVRLTATLLACMFFLFVVLIHVPNVAAKPGDRIVWAVALRDLSFGGGALAMAATQSRGRPALAARFCIAIPLVFFAVEHFLHPGFVPGVPLGKMTPAWMPLPPAWGYVTGLFLLVAGSALLANKRMRVAAGWLGLELTLVVIFLNLPMLAAASPQEKLEGVNYFFDTLLFAGTVLVLAAAIPREN